MSYWLNVVEVFEVAQIVSSSLKRIAEAHRAESADPFELTLILSVRKTHRKSAPPF